MSKNIPKVIVLGAGASCSYSQSPTGVRPPLAREIISTYHKLDVSQNQYVFVGNLINYIRDKRGINPIEFASWDEDLESFFSEVDEKVTKLAEKAKGGKSLEGEDYYDYILSNGAYKQLIFLFAAIFNEIQNGPISIPYMLLASELNTDDVIITFNWDTLLDRALYTSGIWSPSNGYCIVPDAIFDDGWKMPDAFPCNDKNLLYIKLHGSTNWLAPYHSTHLTTGEQYSMSRYAIDKLFIYLKASKEYKTYENRYWGPYEPFSYCYYPPDLPVMRDDIEPEHINVRFLSNPYLTEHVKIVSGETDVYSMPLIIPPVRNKQYLRYGKIFSALWKLAEESMAKCEQLYIIGYSFPETDIAARQLFTNALKKNTLLEKVVIINPHPKKVTEIFINEFGIIPSKLEVREKRFDVPYTHQGKIL